MIRLSRLLCCLAACWASAAAVFADFALRDGDTVAFLGDSITAARGYPKLVENYTLLRFPERRIRYLNAGRGGDTAQKCLERLERDVFQHGATVMTVAVGVNDIGWGMKADEVHRQAYLDGLDEIIHRAQARGVRVFVCSPAITAEAPDQAEQGFLQKMSDDGLALARERGVGVIDVQRFMRSVQRRVLEANAKEKEAKHPARLHVEDGVHLSELGQLVMGFAILKGLGAPAEVTAAEIDAATAGVIKTEGCHVADISRTDGAFRFVRHDERLPLNLHPLWMLNARYLPIGEEFNQYLLKVKNLAPGRYAIFAGGRELGDWDASQIAAGLNLASATANGWTPGGVWDAQAQILKVLTDMRDQAEVARRGAEETLGAHPHQAELIRQLAGAEAGLMTLQRNLAAPVPVLFEIKPLPPKPTPKANIEPREIKYGQAGEEPLLLDVYEPTTALPEGQRRAGVVLVHGGGWCGGARRDVAAEARRQAAQGRVAFAVGYRLVNGVARLENPALPAQNRWPAALDDCQLAVRWIRAHAADFGLDPDRLGAIGFSAGGHLVSLLGTRETRSAAIEPKLEAYSSRVTAVINVFGPTNFLNPLPATNLFGQKPDPQASAVILRVPVQWLVDDFLGSTDVALFREASPQHHIDDRTVPFLTVFGAKDIIVPVAQGREFHAALQAAGRDSSYLEFPDEGHGFGKPDNIRRFKEAIDAFWDKHLGSESK